MRLDVALRPVAALGHHVRIATRVAPGRPALWIGLRMAAAIGVPLVLAPWLAPATATTASLAGYFITLVDKGGAYRARARAMLAASLGALLAVIVGMRVAGTPLAPLVAITGMTACAFGHLWGATGTSIATPTAIVLAIACFRPDAGGPILPAALGIALGASWAMLLSLVVWPVRVYQPGRRAIANVLEALAAHATAIATAAVERGDRDALILRHRRLRDQLETARQILVATRRGRGEHRRGERLLALVHVADQLFGKLLALEEILDTLPPGDAAAVARALAAPATNLDRLAELVLVEAPSRDALAAVIADATRADHAGAALPAEPAHARALLVRLGELIAAGGRLIASLDDAAPAPTDVLLDAPVAIRERVRAAFDLDSAVLRHALRVAISTTVALAIASQLHLAYGYWIVITAYVLLQPNRSATTTRTIQRGLGTVGGVLIAIAIAAAVPQQAVLVAITIAFAAIGASVMQLNYALFALFVTPTFLLLTEMQTHDVALFEVRVLYTVLGGAIAFLASALLWPARERAVFDDLLATALDRAADYARAVHRAVATRAPLPSPEILATRRAFGLALGNAEIALDRLVAERAPVEIVEPRMTIVSLARRLGASINVLGATRAVTALAPHEGARHGAVVEAHLRELATAIRAQRRPPAPQPPTPAGRAGGLAPSVQRLELHLDELTSAIARGLQLGTADLATPRRGVTGARQRSLDSRAPEQ